MAGAAGSGREFRRAARSWSDSFPFADERSHTIAYLKDGTVIGIGSDTGTAGADVVFSGPAEGWEKVFVAEPPPYYQDLVGGACGRQGFTVGGDLLSTSTYYPAIERAAVLARKALRPEVAWCYSQAAPGVFRGDLEYYTVGHDRLHRGKPRSAILDRPPRRHPARSLNAACQPFAARPWSGLGDFRSNSPTRSAGAFRAAMSLQRAGSSASMTLRTSAGNADCSSGSRQSICSSPWPESSPAPSHAERSPTHPKRRRHRSQSRPRPAAAALADPPEARLRGAGLLYTIARP